MNKNKYDTSVIMLYLMNQEELLPKEFRRQIPYSTIASWRKTDYNSYLGSEFRFLFDDQWDVIKLKSQNRKLKRLVKTLIRSWIMLKEERQKLLLLAKKDLGHQSTILDLIEFLRPTLGLRFSLKLIGISRTLYHEWIIISRYSCTASFKELCLKRYPHQLTQDEVQTIEHLLTSPPYCIGPYKLDGFSKVVKQFFSNQKGLD